MTRSRDLHTFGDTGWSSICLYALVSWEKETMSQPTRPAKPSHETPPLKRRGLLAGAGAAAAAVVAVKALPDAAAPAASPASAAAGLANAGGGYQVSPHVLRYYETTRA